MMTPVEISGAEPKGAQKVFDMGNVYYGSFAQELTKRLEKHLRSEEVRVSWRLQDYAYVGAGPEDIGSPGNTPEHIQQQYRDFMDLYDQLYPEEDTTDDEEDQDDENEDEDEDEGSGDDHGCGYGGVVFDLPTNSSSHMVTGRQLPCLSRDGNENNQQGQENDRPESVSISNIAEHPSVIVNDPISPASRANWIKRSSTAALAVSSSWPTGRLPPDSNATISPKKRSASTSGGRSFKRHR